MQHTSPERPPRPVEPLPQACEVVPGIWKITVPIPFPLRTVNIYAVIGKDGWAMLDTGLGVLEARTALQEGLERAGLELKNLKTIVLSHHHPDHVGLSGELQEHSGATVYMHSIDATSIQVIWAGTMPDRFKHVSRFFLQHGLPQTELWFTQVEPGLRQHIIRVPPPEAITTVEDGAYIDLVGERFRVIWTPGHSDGHICLFRERDGVFFAADHVLPRITPNIGLYSEYERQNPLDDYLASLAKVESLPASMVLPGHGEPFTDLATRVQEIIHHHEEREEQLLAMLDEQPQNAYQLALQLFRHRVQNNEAMRMGVAEVLSHLEYLRLTGRLQQQRTKDGMILYTIG
jgi:glyoxylase-like metal-dependent hydrolase (beta-lactamase superfamily II)